MCHASLVLRLRCTQHAISQLAPPAPQTFVALCPRSPPVVPPRPMFVVRPHWISATWGRCRPMFAKVGGTAHESRSGFALQRAPQPLLGCPGGLLCRWSGEAPTLQPGGHALHTSRICRVDVHAKEPFGNPFRKCTRSLQWVFGIQFCSVGVCASVPKSQRAIILRTCGRARTTQHCDPDVSCGGLLVILPLLIARRCFAMARAQPVPMRSHRLIFAGVGVFWAAPLLASLMAESKSPIVVCRLRSGSRWALTHRCTSSTDGPATGSLGG